MKSIAKKLPILVTVMLVFSMLAGCADESSNTASKTPESDEQLLSGAYVFVAKDINNTYMQKIYEGFETACRQLGVTAIYRAPDSPTPEKQKEIIRELTEKKAAGIAIAANDENELQTELCEALDKGIKVISLDSSVNKNSRLLHVQQADPEQIGKNLISTAYDMADGNGGIAILSATSQATNQNLWIEYINKEINENPEKYAPTPIVKTVYGDDDFTKSKTETKTLLEDKNIKVIIAPTAVGIKAAAETIRESGSQVKLTGLGMPSEMAEYIENGICEKMYLWNPSDVGYLAAFTLNELKNNSTDGADGGILNAGKLGSKEILSSADGGTEVILGELIAFDKSNIAEWKDLF